MAAEITRQIVLDLVLERPFVAGRVQARRISIPPATASERHTHNGPVFGCIERGSVVFQVDGGDQMVLRAGDVFHEPMGAVIERFDATDEGAVFIAFFPVGPHEEPVLAPA